MVSNDKSICQNCGSKLKRYDKVSRIVRTKGGKTSWIEIERFRCPVCGQIHRELPDYVFPYKQYEAEVIRGVLEGFITCETYGYEEIDGVKYMNASFLDHKYRPTNKPHVFEIFPRETQLISENNV